MSALADTLRSLQAVFSGMAVDWYVFGAQAVAVRGAPRATQDVDVTVQVDRAGLRALVTRLGQHGITHRYPEIADELLKRGAVLPLCHPSGMEVDLVIAGSGLESLALSRASLEDLDGVTVPVAHATDLVVMKILAGRGKDLDDVRALLASGDPDLAEVRSLLSQLEHALGQSDLLPSLERLVEEQS